MRTVVRFEDFKSWRFPNGEWGVVAPVRLHPSNDRQLVLQWKWPDPLNPDLMLLLMCINALQTMYGRDIRVELSYLPYSRQDRLFEFGGCVANRLFCNAIRETFDVYLYALQPHVECELYGAYSWRPDFAGFGFEDKPFYWVSPDSNAPDHPYGGFRTIGFAKTRHEGSVQLDCVTTCIDLSKSKTAVIFDDLCDGGATFIACAAKLREMGFTEVWLAVAHGFFTKGVDHLYNNGIDGIITTDSVCRLPATEKLIILDAFEDMN